MNAQTIHKQELKLMWKRCFPKDRQAFIDYWFDNIFSPSNALIHTVDNRPAAFLQIIPYKINNGKNPLKAAYLSGIMTHPDFRGRGFASSLTQEAIETARKRGFDLVFLIPQNKKLQPFYGKLGFESCSQQSFFNTIDNKQGISNEKVSVFKSPDPKIFKVYNRLLRKIPYAVLKTESQFKHVLWDFFDGSNRVFLNENAVAFVTKIQKKVRIIECISDRKRAENTLFSYINKYYKTDIIYLLHTPNFPVMSGITGMALPLSDRWQIDNGLYINMMLSE